MGDSTNRDFWQRTAKLYAPFMKSSASLYDAIYTPVSYTHLTLPTN